MIRSLLLSVGATVLVVLGIGFFVNDWFLHGYNWVWIAIPTFWVSRKIFSKLFRILDIIVGIGVIVIILILQKNGINIPSL